MVVPQRTHHHDVSRQPPPLPLPAQCSAPLFVAHGTGRLTVRAWCSCGREFSVFSSFFRLVTGYDEATEKLQYGHALTSSLIDVAGKEHYPQVLLDGNAPVSPSCPLPAAPPPRTPACALRCVSLDIELQELLIKKLDKMAVKDDKIKRAFKTILEKGNVPLPDKMAGQTSCSTSKLAVTLDDNTVVKVVRCVAPLPCSPQRRLLFVLWRCAMRFSPLYY